LANRWNEERIRSDLRAGILASVIANFSMGKGPNQPPFQPYDFFLSIPGPEEDSEEMSFEAMCGVIQLAARAGRRKI